MDNEVCYLRNISENTTKLIISQLLTFQKAQSKFYGFESQAKLEELFEVVNHFFASISHEMSS